MSGLLFSFDGFIERLSSTGASLGQTGPINYTQIDIEQQEPEKIVRESLMRSSYGSALDEASFPKSTLCSIGFDDIDPDLFSLTVYGTVADYSQSEQTAKSASVDVIHDRWVGLESGSITAFEITSKVEGTDYELHAAGGLLKALSTGSIADGASTSYTYTCSARTGKTVKAGSDKSAVILRISGPGENKFTGALGILDIPKVSMSFASTFKFMEKAPVSLTGKGTILLKSGNDYEWSFTEFTET